MIEFKRKIKIGHPMFQFPMFLFISKFNLMELLLLYNFFELHHSSEACSVAC